MIRSISAFFYRIASWKTLLFSILLYLPIPIFLLGPLEKKLNEYAGYAIGPIDLLFFNFDPALIQKMVADYGPQGRAVYARDALIDDTIYPIVYTLVLCIVLSLLFRKRREASWARINVFPLTTLVLDLLENTCLITLLNAYPEPMPTVALLCMLCTNLKWISFFGTVLLAGIGLGQLFTRKPVAGSAASYNRTTE